VKGVTAAASPLTTEPHRGNEIEGGMIRMTIRKLAIGSFPCQSPSTVCSSARVLVTEGKGG